LVILFIATAFQRFILGLLWPEELENMILRVIYPAAGTKF